MGRVLLKVSYPCESSSLRSTEDLRELPNPGHNSRRQWVRMRHLRTHLLLVVERSHNPPELAKLH